MDITEHDRAPEAFLALAAIEPHYADYFTMTVPPGHDAETWARAAFEDAFLSPQGRFLQRRVLRVREPAASDTLGGWAIGARGDGWVRLDGESPLLSSNIIVRVDGDRFATGMVLRFTGRMGRLVWRLVTRKHRQVLPVLLRKAYAELAPLAV